MTATSRLLLRQGHVVWLVSIINISLGFFIAGFNPIAQSISEVGREAPAFAYTHRIADVVIGVCMCAFGLGLNIVGSGKAAFSMTASCLLGASFISAGIWTLGSPLHLLYNLSIVMILVPVACALELKDFVSSRRFETLCLAVSFIHVFMFWCIYAGFVLSNFSGLTQRIWTVVVMGWFGIAAYVIERRGCELKKSEYARMKTHVRGNP
jgi:hypothetical protein